MLFCDINTIYLKKEWLRKELIVLLLPFIPALLVGILLGIP